MNPPGDAKERVDDLETIEWSEAVSTQDDDPFVRVYLPEELECDLTTPLPLYHKCWSTAEVESVAIDDVTFMEIGVRPGRVKHFIDRPEHIDDGEDILVGRTEDGLYVRDGHHRVVAAHLLGWDEVDASVLDVRDD